MKQIFIAIIAVGVLSCFSALCFAQARSGGPVTGSGDTRGAAGSMSPGVTGSGETRSETGAMGPGATGSGDPSGAAGDPEPGIMGSGDTRGTTGDIPQGAAGDRDLENIPNEGNMNAEDPAAGPDLRAAAGAKNPVQVQAQKTKAEDEVDQYTGSEPSKHYTPKKMGTEQRKEDNGTRIPLEFDKRKPQ